MPIHDVIHHSFRFPTICNNILEDLQNFEVRSTFALVPKLMYRKINENTQILAD